MYRYFEALHEPFGAASRETPAKTYWAYMISELRPFRKVLPVMMFAGLIVALMESGLIFYSGRVIDLMGAAGPDGFWSTHGGELLIAAAFILLARPALIGFHHLLLEQTLAANMQSQVRWRAHRHLLGQSTGFFQNDYAGRLSNRVIQLGEAVEDSVYMAMEAIWYFLVYILGAIFLLSQMDWRIALPMVIWLMAYGFYTLKLAFRVEDASEKLSAGRSLLTGRVVDAYANIDSVKLFADDGREESYSLFALKRHRVRFMRFLRLMTELSFVLNILNGFMILGVLGPALWLWTQNSVSTGEVAAASALVFRLNGMSGWITWVTIRLFEHAGTIHEGLESISVPHQVTDTPGAPALTVGKGEVRFDNLTHRYGRETGGVEQVNLTIAPGEKVGLVGRSGAGKSSLVNLLLRFRDAEGGGILIDGQNVSDVQQSSLRSQIGMVTQDSSLLHRSVRANILYGNAGASDAEMILAAERAEAHEFIQDLVDPQGRTSYDAHVGERGVKLSGGQRQRIALARVILKDAPILVLDEATSALDSEVEAAIQQTLYGVMEGKTVIAIAHRLSTIAAMDRIVVMDAGEIAEFGTHDALLARGGLYAGFWNRQSGGFLDVAAAG